ncbi:MAG TPA: acyl-CoA reductase [Chitinophagaceae bacterium]
MILQHRVRCLHRLRGYILGNDTSWKQVKEKASSENGWFIPEFVELALKNIAHNFLEEQYLSKWAAQYGLVEEYNNPKTVGLVTAGNIPLVGFHDVLSIFMSGHKAIIKQSSRDQVLLKHLTSVLTSWESEVDDLIRFSDILKNCDAYIATGSNNTSRYFEYYFGKYPHIIRRNRTSVAILGGDESDYELEKLADDVYQFFGLGCRNVTKIYVPANYNFEPMLLAFERYNYLADHHKYKNNYDYNLAIHILNNKFYMTNGSLLLVEDSSMFSPISQLNYEYYSDQDSILSSIADSQEIQSVISRAQTPFGRSQSPGLLDYADGVDTMAFLQSL